MRHDRHHRPENQKLMLSLCPDFGTVGQAAPHLVSSNLVATDILALIFESRYVQECDLLPYTAQAGDTITDPTTGFFAGQKNVLTRDGVQMAWVIGPSQNYYVTFEQAVGSPETAATQVVLDLTTTYSVSSSNDANYLIALNPSAVGRKTKPFSVTVPGKQYLLRHIVYLTLPFAVVQGKTYTLSMPNLGMNDQTGILDSTTAQSEAVHCIQSGYRTDDPAKYGFLSLWRGSGGKTTYSNGFAFQILDNVTGAVAFSGTSGTPFLSTTVEQMRPWNFIAGPQVYVNRNMTDVHPMDFSAFTTAGTYRLYVVGIGCSYPFVISNSPNPWTDVFKMLMKGIFNQRSGIALETPYTTFLKPIDWKPGAGLTPPTVYQTTRTILDNTTVAVEIATNGSHLPAASTGVANANAYGGWHDAGDWNPRRVTHLKTAMALMEAFSTNTAFYAALDLSIPIQHAGLPGVLDEAMWGIDCFRRLQDISGGAMNGSVPFGIETNGDPANGPVSWIPTDNVAYLYSASASGAVDKDSDPYSSWVYAASAARASRLIAAGGYDAALAAALSTSATNAANYAEASYAARVAGGTTSKIEWFMLDARCLCAVEMLALTAGGSGSTWDLVASQNLSLVGPFFVNNVRDQAEIGFAYARLPGGVGTTSVKTTMTNIMKADAATSHTYQAGNAWGIASPLLERALRLGFYSSPDATEATRAYQLTGTASYLFDACLAAHWSLGCNPANTTYLTGLGSNFPVRMQHDDSRFSGQPSPIGLNPPGNIDFADPENFFNSFLTSALGGIDSHAAAYPVLNGGPGVQTWPIHEAWFDIGPYPAANEWLVDRGTNRNIIVWGGLAARP